mmetsp:Transcript_5990/g.9570  ORF Transcript_5990/g.9570 Transcript_5990/m.9570 type:complete len:262 (+) Transcript_5990:86-871(+)
MSSRGLALISLLVAWLPRPRQAADTLDVSVRMYRDSNCFERQDELLLLDGGCYANTYSNLTKGYKVKIVSFDGQQKVDIYDYEDNCNTQFRPPRTIRANTCERFVGGFFANIDLRLRSSTCVGDCSRLAVAVQRFYSEALCKGLAYQVYNYPVQNECMRWSNGTQVFLVDPTNTNITQIDYVGDDKCSSTALTRTYTMVGGQCYYLYADRAPRSFSWTIDRADAAGISGVSRPLLYSAQTLALAAPLAMLGSGAFSQASCS